MPPRSAWLAPLLLAAMLASARADDPAEHARQCACGTACRGKSCCCGKRAAAKVKATPTPTPAASTPSPCVAADPCGGRGDLPTPPSTPPWARIAGLPAAATGRDVASVGRVLPDTPPPPLGPVGRRPDEPPEAGRV